MVFRFGAKYTTQIFPGASLLPSPCGFWSTVATQRKKLTEGQGYQVCRFLFATNIFGLLYSLSQVFVISGEFARTLSVFQQTHQTCSSLKEGGGSLAVKIKNLSSPSRSLLPLHPSQKTIREASVKPATNKSNSMLRIICPKYNFSPT